MKKYILFAAAAITLAACTNDDNYIDEPVAAEISATIGQSDVTRAHDTAWDEGDRIGITSSANMYVNIPYEYSATSGTGKFTGNTIFFKDKRKQESFTAYYPYKGSSGSAAGTITATTKADDQKDKKNFDFLYAKAENLVAETSSEVKLMFAHKMSKITFTFVDGDGMEVGKILTYTISGLKLAGSFDTATGECKATADAAESLTMSVSGLVSETATDPLIVFPQTLGGKVTMKIEDNDGQYYTCDLNFEGNEIKSGNNYLFTIKVNKTGLNIKGMEIVNWTTVTVSDNQNPTNADSSDE